MSLRFDEFDESEDNTNDIIVGITVSNAVPGGGVSTGFINEATPQVLSSTSSTRPSQQVIHTKIYM